MFAAIFIPDFALEAIVRTEPLLRERAVAVLEDIATPAARQVLETLSKGAPAARQTQESRAALERLSQRSATAPGKIE